MTAEREQKAALVVVDMQEDFCLPHGTLGVEGGRELAVKINALLGLPGWTLKLATRDYHPPDHISFASSHVEKRPFEEHTIHNPENNNETQTTLLWPDHCVAGTKGCNFIPELNMSLITNVITKGQDKRVESYSAFGPPFRNPPVAMSDLDQQLEAAGVTHVFVVGLAYDYCVKCTAIDAAKYGYTTFVIQDASNPVSREPHDRVKTGKAYEEAGVHIIDSTSPVLKTVLERQADT